MALVDQGTDLNFIQEAFELPEEWTEYILAGPIPGQSTESLVLEALHRVGIQVTP